jgi:hypothetical protein
LNDSSENIANKIVLSAEQIEDSAQHLLPYYCKGTRDKFAFGFSGFCIQEDIAAYMPNNDDIAIKKIDRHVVCANRHLP